VDAVVETWRDREFDRGPAPDDQAISAICRRHGFQSGSAKPMATTGLANWIYAISDEAVLRIPATANPDAVDDAYTESVAVPAVVAAGVKTPQLLVFDDSAGLIEVPYTIYEMVRGEDLGRLSLDGSDAQAIYESVGRELARLHGEVTSVPDPDHRLDQPGRWTTVAFAESLQDKGFLDPNSVAVVADLWQRLSPALDGAETYRRFLHQDLKTTNLMSSDGRFAAIIDWGDAGWGDPSLEFRYLPMRAAAWALAGYRDVMPIDGDDTVEARILWDQLWCAVSQVDLRPTPRPRGSNRDRPGSRLVDLIGFLTTGFGREWLDRTGI